MTDGRLVVCTAIGEVILCSDEGQFICLLGETPIENNGRTETIEAITPYSRGFLVAGNENIYAFEKSTDPKSGQYYKLVNRRPIEVKIETKDSLFSGNVNWKVSSLCLSHGEDFIYLITKSK